MTRGRPFIRNSSLPRERLYYCPTPIAGVAVISLPPSSHSKVSGCSEMNLYNLPADGDFPHSALLM
nr:hypothetical protein Q903MT_gene2212 [Picea sitchensis]